MRMIDADCPQLSPDALERSEIQNISTTEIDAVDAPVLISIGILHIENMPAGVRPEVASDAPVGIIGYGLRLLRSICRPYPDVEHAVFGARKLMLDPSGLILVVILSGLPKSRSREIRSREISELLFLVGSLPCRPPPPKEASSTRQK